MKYRWIEGDTAPGYIPCQETTIPGVREATPRDIARNREAVTPKTSDPFVLEGIHGNKMIPQERHHPILEKWTRQTAKERDTTKKI